MTLRIGLPIVLALAFVSSLSSHAICATARQIGTVNGSGYSYIYTPGLCDGGYPCQIGFSSVTPELSGDFWVLGAGDPAVGFGVDYGGWPATEGASALDGWVDAYVGYAAYILATWNSDARIDGCPDSVAPPGTPGLCAAIHLSDQFEGVGYFALMTAENDAIGDYAFNQPGNGPIELAEIPRAMIVSRSGPEWNPTITLSPPAIGGGLYLDAACPDPLVAYRVYGQELPNGAPAPVDRSLAAHRVDLTGDVALDALAQFTYDCPLDVDYYVATQLVFESGFATDVLSRNSLRVECGPNYTEIEERPRIGPGTGLSLRRTKRALER